MDASMTEFRYANGGDGSTFTITGTLIGHGDTRDDGKDQWVEVDIIRTESGQYAIHRAGMSRRYHRAGNDTCKRRGGSPSGSPAVRADLPDDAVSCDVCEPPWAEELKRDERVLFEYPRHSVKVFATPGDVLADLYGIRGQSGSRGLHASRPARAALVAAKEADPAFADIEVDLDIR